MTRFIQGEHRGQRTLLPESQDYYVADTNPVRVVDLFVDERGLGKLGFDGVVPADTGRPAYHPAVLLKIYIYGYLNRIQSTRLYCMAWSTCLGATVTPLPFLIVWMTPFAAATQQFHSPTARTAQTSQQSGQREVSEHDPQLLCKLL